MNLRSKQFLTVILLALVGASTSVFAQDTGWYAGASFGQSSFKDGCTGIPGGVSCEDTDTALGIFGGYQVNKHFGAELGYTDLGTVSASGLGITASIKSKGFELLAVGTAPINEQFSVYGKFGFFSWDLDSSASGFGASFSQSESGTDLTYGFGVKYNFTKSIGVRVQYQIYKDIGNEATTGTSDVDVISVGVVFKF